MYQRRTQTTKERNVERREWGMSINKMYITGLIFLFIGLILFYARIYTIGGFFIGSGFILVLKSYGNK